MEGGLIYVDVTNSQKPQIIHLNLANGKQTVLYNYSQRIDHPDPAYNPNEKNNIYFADKDVGGNYRIYAFDLNNQEKKEFKWSCTTKNNDRHLAFDKTGRKMVFQSNRSSSSYQVYVIGWDSSQDLQLVAGGDSKGQAPVISPDGTRVAYICNGTLVVIDCTTAVPKKINPSDVNLTGTFDNPSWKPEPGGVSNVLAVELINDENEHTIYALMNPFDPNPQVQQLTFKWDGKKANHRHPVWSGDGSVLFFTGTMLKSDRPDLFGVYFEAVLEKGIQAQWYQVSDGIAKIKHPCWAPDLQLPQSGPVSE